MTALLRWTLFSATLVFGSYKDAFSGRDVVEDVLILGKVTSKQLFPLSRKICGATKCLVLKYGTQKTVIRPLIRKAQWESGVFSYPESMLHFYRNGKKFDFIFIPQKLSCSEYFHFFHEFLGLLKKGGAILFEYDYECRGNFELAKYWLFQIHKKVEFINVKGRGFIRLQDE